MLALKNPSSRRSPPSPGMWWTWSRRSWTCSRRWWAWLTSRMWFFAKNKYIFLQNTVFLLSCMILRDMQSQGQGLVAFRLDVTIIQSMTPPCPMLQPFPEFHCFLPMKRNVGGKGYPSSQWWQSPLETSTDIAAEWEIKNLSLVQSSDSWK